MCKCTYRDRYSSYMYMYVYIQRCAYFVDLDLEGGKFTWLRRYMYQNGMDIVNKSLVVLGIVITGT